MNERQTTASRPPAWSPPEPRPQRLETDRFTIRPYALSDAPALFRAVESSRAHFLPWLPWAASQHTSVDASRGSIAKFIESSVHPTDPANNAVFGFVMGVFDRATGELVAGTGYNRIHFESAEAETGYWVAASHVRRGIAFEVASSIISWAFTPQADSGWGFRRVRLFASEPNVASCGVIRKLGIRQESRAVRDRWADGHGWCDSLGWGVLAEEWDRSRHRPIAGAMAPSIP